MDNRNHTTTVCTPEILDSLQPGMILPGAKYLSLSRLSEIEGELIYIDARLNQPPGLDHIVFVIENKDQVVSKYSVDLSTYVKVRKYMLRREASFPLKLPLDLQN